MCNENKIKAKLLNNKTIRILFSQCILLKHVFCETTKKYFKGILVSKLKVM